MTRNEITQFLKEGAFIRTADAQVHLYSGPFAEDSKDKDLLIQDFFSKAPSGFKSANHQVISVSKLKSALIESIGDTKLGFQKSDFQNPDQQEFQDAFQLIQGKIQRGEIEKAVPIISATVQKTVSESDLATMIIHGLDAFSKLWVYGYWKDGQGIIGATPEILFQMTDRKIRSMALAGTCPKSELSTRKPLLKDDKELKEHELVVVDIAKVLERWGWVKRSGTEVLDFPSMLHLCTWLEVDTKQLDPVEVIKLLHPTPALGVAPRNYGSRWMVELPFQKNRRWFGAPIGFQLDKNEFLTIVAIRNLQWDQKQSWVSAGCGIVANSELDREWRELGVKMETTMKIFGISKE